MSRPAQVPFVQQIATLRATVAELRAKNVKLRDVLEGIEREAKAMEHGEDCDMTEDWCECSKQFLLTVTGAALRGEPK